MIKLGMIGGGVMGEALLSRLVAQRIYQGEEILVSEPLASRRDFLKETYQVLVTDNNQEVARAQEVVLLAIKPQVFDGVATQLVGANLVAPVLISILAGMPLSRLESAFPGKGVVRVMPNTPATVGEGISAIAFGNLVKPAEADLVKKILMSVGEVVEVAESLMDAVTGLSGSGPAYVALLVEALADGGVYAGLPRQIASKLALQTVLGTAVLLQEKGLHPAQLKDQVASPGGTTIAGIAELERSGFRSALIEAVKAATRRSQELGQ